MNTWGIYSVNSSTFNTTVTSDVNYPKEVRDKVYTALKINNLVFNILGYIPVVSIISGSIRMAIGLVMVIGTVGLGDPNAKQGALIGRFYFEALATGVAQIARGALEVIPFYGQLTNLILDVVATPWNLWRSAFWDYHCCHCYGCDDGRASAHEKKAPTYPLLLKPLHVV